MTASLNELLTAVSRQAVDLGSLSGEGGRGLVAQQLLYQSRLDPATRSLVGPATARLRQFAASAPATITLRTCWTTSAVRERFRPNRGEIKALAVSADGSAVLFSGDDSAVYRWSPRSGIGRAEWLGTVGGLVEVLSCTAQADRIVVGARDGRVHLWQLAGGETRPAVLWQHEGYVRAAQISADGSAIVSLGDEPGFAVWQGKTRLGDPEIVAAHAHIAVLAMNRTGSHAVYATDDATIWRCPIAHEDRARQAQPVGALPGNRILHLAASDDGAIVLATTRDGYLRVWTQADSSLGAGRVIGRSALPLWSITLAGNGSTVVGGGTDGRVLSWELGAEGLDSGTVLGVHDRSVTVVASDEQGSIFSGGRDGVLLRCQLSPAQRPADRQSTNFEVWDVRCVPGSDTALTAGRDGMYRWDLADGEPPHPKRVSDASVKRFACLPDSPGIVALTYDSRLLVGTAGEIAGSRVFNEQGKLELNDVAVIPGGRAFLTAGQDGMIRRWNLGSDTDRSEEIGSHGPTRIRALAVAPDGSFLVSCDDRHLLLRWELDGRDQFTRQHIRQPHQSPAAVRCLAISSDSAWLVAGDDAGNVWRFGATAFAEARLLGRHRQGSKVRAIQIAADDRWIASLADDGELRCWAADGSGMITSLIPSALPRSLAISGHRLLVGDRNGGLTLFHVLGYGYGTKKGQRPEQPAGFIKLPVTVPATPPAVTPVMTEADLAAADDLVRRAFAALPSATPTASQLKVKMCELQPGFDEKTLGFDGFRGFLAHLPQRVRVIGQLGGDVIVQMTGQ